MRYRVTIDYKMPKITNPKPFVNSLLGNEIICRTKWGQKEYRGYLVSVDGDWNLRLANTKESIGGDDTSSTNLGDVFIRANSVLYIRGSMEKENNAMQEENGNLTSQKYNIDAT